MEILSKAALHAKKQPFMRRTGIYALWDQDEIVYIGQTTYSVEGRIASHLYDKEFDAFTFIEIDIPKEDLDFLEAEYIFQYSPKYNRSLPHNPRYRSRYKIQKDLGIDGWQFRRIRIERGIAPNALGYYDIEEFRTPEKEAH